MNNVDEKAGLSRDSLLPSLVVGGLIIPHAKIQKEVTKNETRDPHLRPVYRLRRCSRCISFFFHNSGDREPPIRHRRSANPDVRPWRTHLPAFCIWDQPLETEVI
jgi:hypothetical protein